MKVTHIALLFQMCCKMTRQCEEVDLIAVTGIPHGLADDVSNDFINIK